MLSLLRRITQDISQIQELDKVLNIIVSRVKQAIQVDVCSIYLQNPLEQRQYVLMATDGLNQNGVGQISLNAGHGLVGLVALKGEMINTANAHQHPKFHYFPELEEKEYQAFSACPIIHHKKIYGVIVVQSRQNQAFSQDAVDFLLTISAQLATIISHARTIDSGPKLLTQNNLFQGIAVSPGIAIGTATQMVCCQQLLLVPDRKAENRTLEKNRFNCAINAVEQEIQEIITKLADENLADEDIAIFDIYRLMLKSGSFVNRTLEFIDQGQWAPGALRRMMEQQMKVFNEMKNLYFKERIKDIQDLGQWVLNELIEQEKVPQLKENSLLIAEDFSVMTLSQLDSNKVKGLVSVKGSQTSHVAIIARAMGIPTVMGLEDIPLRQIDGQPLIIDGYSGIIYLSPNQQILDKYYQYQLQEQSFVSSLDLLKDKSAVTLDNITIPLYINLGAEENIDDIKNCGADGVGLFRTEFPFMASEHFPGEQKQLAIYQNILARCAPKPVILRTLDIGGDKQLNYFPIEEDNPFLGWRGVRISLDHPEIFIIQLRAMLLADMENDNLQIMFPMVSSIDEIEACYSLLLKAQAELSEEGYAVKLPKIGIMIEVPSLIFQIDKIADLVDFVSIGSNDLIQYLLAVDRNNPNVAELYEPLQPAVITAIDTIVKEAHKHGLEVSICGEMASDPLACILLLGMHIDTLSINLSSLGRIKWIFRHFSQSEAKSALNYVLKLSNAVDVRFYLQKLLKEKGLSKLFRAGS